MLDEGQNFAVLGLVEPTLPLAPRPILMRPFVPLFDPTVDGQPGIPSDTAKEAPQLEPALTLITFALFSRMSVKNRSRMSQLDVEPAKYFVLISKHEMRACKSCEEQIVVSALLPARIISSPHERSSVLRSDRKPHNRPSVEDLQTVPKTVSVHPVLGPDGSRTLPFLPVGCTATDRLDDSSRGHRAFARPPGFHWLGYKCCGGVRPTWGRQNIRAVRTTAKEFKARFAMLGLTLPPTLGTELYVNLNPFPVDNRGQ